MLRRREFLAALGATAAAPALPGVRPRGGSFPFVYGVASADPLSDRVVIWTRVEPDEGPLTWTVSTDGNRMDPVIAHGTAEPSADTDWTAQVDVTGLAPSTTYYYRFEARGRPSPVGRTRTLPSGPIDRLRLGVVSCSRYATHPFGVYRALSRRSLDLVVHLGDYIYEDGGAQGDVRQSDPPKRLTTLDEYRTRYRQARSDPDLQELHRLHPMAAIWDDHEIAGNAWRHGARDHDEARDGPWERRLTAAVRAHAEWVPMRRPNADDPLQIWRALPLGDLGELVLLDTRIDGRDQQVNKATVDTIAEPSRSLLGSAQRAFLVHKVKDRTRPWVLVANQVMINPLRLPVPTPALVKTIEDHGFLVIDGQALNPDQWDGYPAERDGLLNEIGDRAGVVFLTGDVHSSWAFQDPIELVAPSVTSATLGEALKVPAGLLQTAVQGTNPGLQFVDTDHHGYVVVDVTPERVTGEWYFVDPDKPDTDEFARGYVAEAGRANELTPSDVALGDPAPTTTSTTSRVAPPTFRPPAAKPKSGTNIAPTVGAAVVAAALAGAVAVRRRRST